MENDVAEQSSKNGVEPGEWSPLELEKVAWLFPQFAILGMVGRGTVGAVYWGFDAAGDRTVAIKVLPLEISLAPGLARIFAKTLPLVSQLSHGHIVAVNEFGLTAQEHLFFIAAYVEGTTLRDRIKAGELTPMQVFAMMEQVCDATHHAHGHGVIHGALHPGNVFVDQHGPVKVADFGMSRFRLPEMNLNGASAYLAPEQVSGLHVDHRADVFSVGVMLYEALTGDLPHADSPPASERVAVHPRIDAVIARAMESSPEARYPSCADLMRAIAAVRALAAPAVHVTTGPVLVARAAGAEDGSVKKAAPVPQSGGKRKQLPIWIGGGVSALALVAAGYIVSQSGRKSAAPPTPAYKVAEWPTIATPAPQLPPVKEPAKLATQPKAPPKPAPRVETKAPAAVATWVPIVLDDASTGGATVIEGGGIHLTKSVRFDRFHAKDIAVRATIRLGEEGKAAQLWLRNAPPARLQIVLDGKPKCFIQTMTAANKAKTVGTVTAPWVLLGDRWVTVEFAAVGAKLFGAVNDRPVPVETPSEVLEAGGIGIYSMDADIKDLAVMTLDNVPPEQYPEFVKTALAAALAKATPEPAAPPMAAAPPATEGPKASPEVETWLATVAKPFEEKYQREVAGPFEIAVSELRKNYIATVDRQSAAASQAAKLDEALAWRTERQRFFDSGHNMPAGDADNPIAAIKPLRAGFRAQFAKLDRERYEKARAQLADYDAVLAKNQIALTQAQRLDDALLLKTKREELAKSWLVPPAAAPQAVTPAPPVGAKTTGMPEPAKQSLRETVNWLLANGTDLTFYDGKKWGPVIDSRLLPPGKPAFKVKIDVAKFKAPPAAAEMERLGSLRVVTSFETNTRLDDQGFAFLRELQGVERLLLPGDKITDAISENLAALSELKFLQIHGGPDLTGKTLDVLAKFPGLRHLSLENSGITDEGAEAIAKITSIEELYLRKTKITDVGLASLAKLRNLRRLGLNETAVTADGLAALKGLKNLESVGFLTSDLPDYADAVKKMAINFPRLLTTRVQGKALGKEHFEPLAGWRGLIHLAIGDSELQDGAVPAMGKLVGLEWLEITNTAFGDVDVDALLGLKSLKRITLGSTKITDTGLLKLKALKNLKEVNVPNTPVTLEGARALEREHAGCKVTR
ncbi:MAG: protein kinase [Chthoniobacteraceae bacterium]